MAQKSYIVICQQVVGNPDSGFTIGYYTGYERYATRDMAIREGFKTRRSDDFNIGVLEGERLVSFDWMNEPLEYDRAEMDEISRQLGLETD